ncbi:MULTISPECIES: CHAT domain-containing protein [unclassified Leptolyngbya]|uniref:CHAT domain-containing protein n=1 Tax=unclassified Leptolyngbya TaxID=2650499 RepID=UPI001686F3C3|nr:MULTISPECIES: CHAT domain-containing protein [unclassified Leptolyngbya]MBD1913066.1 CHAT domain-containing protein [Leptolyngbya sp. FACHB-8]MBD2154433.1 CHAT domain-containing protein [Leptolyngbya sp. FACHB-16]
MALLPAIAISPDSITPSVTEVVQSHGSSPSRQLYEAGRYQEAAQQLEVTAADAETRGDRRSQAIALRNLSLVYQQLGQWKDAETAITQSLALLNAEQADPSLVAQTLDVQGRLQFYRGDGAAALATWEAAAALYDRQGDRERLLQAQLNQAEALQSLGFYQRAIALLSQLQETSTDQPDSLQQVERLTRLGNALRVAGDLPGSVSALEASLAMAERLQDAEAIAQSQASLGNTLYAQGNLENALRSYEQATQTAIPYHQVQARLNQLRVLVEQQQVDAAIALIPALQTQINALPPGRPRIHTQINLADSLLRLVKLGGHVSENDIANLLTAAVQQARELGDRRAESYALGTLGATYEQARQWNEAQSITDQALRLAQQLNVPELRYLWEWQQGRLFRQQHNRKEAIAAYTNTINTLQAVRRDLSAANPDAQLSFRNNIEPIHRELVSLLLDRSANPSQKELEQARSTIESLQLAELDNFFREACLNAREVQVDSIDTQAAVFYPILLRDRMAVIVALPGQPLQYYDAPVPASTVIETSNAFANQAEDIRKPVRQIQGLGRQLYDWLVRPALPYLQGSEVKTLVFVPDGVLRKVPLAALYDGDRYLIENYGVAIAPTLQLLSAESLPPDSLTALMGGLSEARLGFAPLPWAEAEVNQLQDIVSGEVLFNDAFTREEIATRIAEIPAPIVHLATHGEFGATLEETYILTWNDRLNVNQLSELLQSADINRRRPIELLVLSACGTAVGNDRAALGLAGVAVRSGARSTIASLWYVEDQSTFYLMLGLYANLSQPGISRAEALRQAQLALINGRTEFQLGSRARSRGATGSIDLRNYPNQAGNRNLSHPYYWSAFVLIGNWK